MAKKAVRAGRMLGYPEAVIRADVLAAAEPVDDLDPAELTRLAYLIDRALTDAFAETLLDCI